MVLVDKMEIEKKKKVKEKSILLKVEDLGK